MYKNISILGSTGSIGTQALEVCRTFGIKVEALAAGKNIDLIEKQAREFKPKIISVSSEADALILAKNLSGLDIKVLWGEAGAEAVAKAEAAQCVVSAIVGIAGLVPTIAAIRAGKDIALANKEVLVTGGAFVMNLIREMGVKLLPVDSEHSAIFQSLYGNNKKEVKKILLTASGGPFRNKGLDEMKSVTLDDALKHPNWSMGKKITIDSATMMNKGLEVIEAKWLFDVEAEQIEILVHPESIVHSAVEYVDSSVIAQLGLPDMKLPIQLALTYPARCDGGLAPLDLTKIGSLNFQRPNLEVFKCIGLAYRALKEGGLMCVVLNAANEIAVQLFLDGKISFLEIADLIEATMNKFENREVLSIEDIIETDKKIRNDLMEEYK